MAKRDDSRFFDAESLRGLGDGIFAIAMTLLILSLETPRVPIENLKAVVFAMIPDVFTFILSFFLLAMFWITNHVHMKKLKKVDGRLVWINMLFFLFVIFVPFTTKLYAFYDGSKVAMLIFNANMLLIGLVFLVEWHHLAANKMHHDDFNEKEIRDRYYLAISLIFVALLALLIGLFYPLWASLVYFIMFVLRLTSKRNRSKEEEE